MPTALRTLVTAVAATAVAVGVGFGLTGADDDGSPEPVAVPSVPLEDLDTTTLAVRRTGFCAAVDPERVAEAVGGEPTETLAHRPGDPAPVGAGSGSGSGDLAHEHGCRWSGPDGRAGAWVFVPPVTADRATSLARAATRSPGCAPVSDAPAYGAPSAALVCTTDRRTEASYRGLFGDAWLVCTLGTRGRADPAAVAELTDRAGRWCAAVATAAAAGAG